MRDSFIDKAETLFNKQQLVEGFVELVNMASQLKYNDRMLIIKNLLQKYINLLISKRREGIITPQELISVIQRDALPSIVSNLNFPLIHMLANTQFGFSLLLDTELQQEVNRLDNLRDITPQQKHFATKFS